MMLLLSLLLSAVASGWKFRKSNNVLGRLGATFEDGKAELEEVFGESSDVKDIVEELADTDALVSLIDIDALLEMVEEIKEIDEPEDVGHVYDSVADLVDRSLSDDKITALAAAAVAVYEQVLAGTAGGVTLEDLAVEDCPVLAGNQWHAAMVAVQKVILGDGFLGELRAVFAGLVLAVESGELDVVEYYKTATAMAKSKDMQAEAVVIFGSVTEAGRRRRLQFNSCSSKCKKWGPFADVSSRWCWCKCGNAGDVGDSCSSFCPCKSENWCQHGSHKCVRRRELHENCGGSYPCVKSLECWMALGWADGICCEKQTSADAPNEYYNANGGTCEYDDKICTSSGCTDKN